MQVNEYALFPTRLLAIQFPDTAELNREIEAVFANRPEFRGDFDMHPGSLNLLRLAGECPCLAAVRGMLLDGVRRWLRTAGVRGELAADVVLFSNIAERGDFTVVHNHNADLVGVYYVRTSPTDRPAVYVPDPDGDYDYFAQEDGALILHDPRFNANLAGVGSADYAKVFPRPGLLVLFPGYLWHSVTPHRGDYRRLALSANISLRWPTATQAETYSINVDEK